MKLNLKNPQRVFQSKRFISFIVAIVLFVGMVFLTTYTPMELAGAITMLCGVYIGAETLRGSNGTESIEPTKTTTTSSTENSSTTVEQIG